MLERFVGPVTLVEIAWLPLWIIIAMPLLAAVLTALFQREGQSSNRLATFAAASVGASALVLAVDVYQLLEVEPRILHSFAWKLVRIGSLEASFAFDLDALAATTVGLVSLAGVTSLLAGAPQIAPASRRRFVASTLLLVASANLLVLADNLVVTLMGWEGTAVASYLLLGLERQRYKNVSAGLRAFALHRVGDVLFAMALIVLFWAMGGTWSSDGRYYSDYRARFVAVHQGEDTTPDTTARDIHHAPAAGSLSLTAYPGAAVYRGIVDESQLLGKPTPIAVSPFSRAPIDAGAHLIAIIPGQGSTVGGDGREGALLEVVRVAPGEEVSIATVGSTLSYRELANQLVLENGEGEAFLRDSLLAKRLWGMFGGPGTVCLLLLLAIAARSALWPLSGSLCGARTAPAATTGLVWVLGFALPGAYLLSRLSFLFSLSEGAGWVLVGLGAVTALWGAVTSWNEPSVRRLLAGVVTAHLGIVACGMGAGAEGASLAYAIGLVPFAVTLTLCAGALSRALGRRDGSPATLDLNRLSGLGARLPRLRTIAGLALASAVVGAPALALGDIAVRLATSERASGVFGVAAALAVVGAATLAAATVSRGITRAFAGETPKRYKKLDSGRAAGAAWLLPLSALGLALSVGVGALSFGGTHQLASFDWLSPTAVEPLIPRGAYAAPSSVRWLLSSVWLMVAGGALFGNRRALRAMAGPEAYAPRAPGGWAERGERAAQLGQRAAVRSGWALRRVGQELERYVIGLPIEVASSVVAGGITRLARRSPARVRIVVVLLAAIALAMLTLTATTAWAHEDATPQPRPRPTGPAGHLVVHGADGGHGVELTWDAAKEKHVGVFEIENDGPGALHVSGLGVRVAVGDPLAPPGLGALIENAGKSVRIAPGERRRVIVDWNPRVSRAQEIYAHVLVESDSLSLDSARLDRIVAVGVHGEERTYRAGLAEGLPSLRPFLSTLLWVVPMLGALGLALFRRKFPLRRNHDRAFVLSVLGLELTLATFAYAHFDREFTSADGHGGFQFIEHGRIGSLPFEYHLGVDGLSIGLILVTALVAFLVAAAAPKSFGRRDGVWALLMLATGSAIGLFVALDLILWFGFAQLMMLSTAFLLASAGGGLRAGLRMGLTGTLGGALLLIAILWLGWHADPTFAADGTPVESTFDLVQLSRNDWVDKGLVVSGVMAIKGVWVLLLTGLLALTGVFPAHAWLTKASTETEPVVLAFVTAIVLKTGIYGVLRIGLGVLPEAAAWSAPAMGGLGLLSLLYGGVAALGAKDLRQLLAYLSMSQIGFALLGCSSLTPQGIEGAVVVCVAHALITTLLYLLASALWRRTGTTEIDRFGGLASQVPRLTSIAMLGAFAAIGVPGLVGFWGELLTLVGAFGRHGWFVALGGVGMVLTAIAVLWAMQRMFFGSLRREWHKSKLLEPFGGKLPEMGRSEAWPLLLLAGLIALLGLWPRPLLDPIDGAALDLHRHVDAPDQLQIARTGSDEDQRFAAR